MSDHPWTSILAYRRLLPTLTARRRETLKNLLRFHDVNKFWPTGQELEAASFFSGVWKRLSELADEHHCIHRGPRRRCNVTGSLADTWIAGPGEGKDPAELPVDEGLQRRLAVLRSVAPDVPFEVAKAIFACTERKLYAVWELPEEKGDQLDLFSGAEAREIREKKRDGAEL